MRYMTPMTPTKDPGEILRIALLNEITQRAHANSKAHGFWDGLEHLKPGDASFIPEKLMLIVSECAEALESYRKGEPLSFYGKKQKPEGIAAELADVVIRVCDLAGALKIDLGKAVEEKHAYNVKRPRKHGKKC
jgi:NTP pyrophosphatase (non-canonical NTP hydrolase)